MNLRIFDTLDDLHRAVARTLLQRIEGQESARIAISGGSTPAPLYTMLGASPWRDELAKVAITWVVVDERYVPIDDPQSNAGMIERTLFAEGLSAGHSFLRFKTELDDPGRTARTFEDEWDGDLDIVMLGVGDDGHTASLFPGTSALEVEDRIATEVFVPKLDAWRVTITKPVIRAAKLRIVIAPGASKAAIIRDVHEGVDHPIAIVTRGVETWWFVDRFAARS